MKIAIEELQLEELQSFLREQAEDTFPDLKDADRLRLLSEKWHSYAEFSTCRNDDGRLVGMIAFYANQPDGGVVYITHVYVASKCRCKGIFKKMLETIEHITQNGGYHLIKLEVSNENIVALRSYEKTGFLMSEAASKKTVFLTKPIARKYKFI